MSFPPGSEIIPEYGLEGTLGGGGFGEVYKVRSLRTGRYFALKTLRKKHLQNENIKRAFIDEIIMWLQLGEHKNIARAIQRFAIAGRDFLLIEFVDGITLKDLVHNSSEGRLSLWQVLDVGIQFCEAMTYCSEIVKGFVHRDIKPDNLMYTRKGVLKVIDFGLAEGIGWQTIMSERSAGTPAYMAPEVRQRSKPTVKSDLFAFGITLFELYSGQLRPMALLEDYTKEAALSGNEGGKELLEIVNKCVITRQYEDFAELKDDLSMLKEGIVRGKITVPEKLVCAQCQYVPVSPTEGACPLCEGGLVPWQMLGEFVVIPEGKFIKGCSRDMAINVVKSTGLPEENIQNLQHIKFEQVFLKEYSIGKYPVTNNEYYEFVRETAYPRPNHWAPNGPPFPPMWANHPVVGISFRDAEAFCKWFTQKRGIRVRLPSPLEWEKAARGTNGFIYSWGNRFENNMCWSLETEKEGWVGIRTTPVGEFPYGNSPYGLEDMGGNVWEWIESFDPYKELRGGSWRYAGQITALSFLSLIRAAPGLREIDFGFRIVLEYQKGDPQEDLLVAGCQFVYIPGSNHFPIGCPPKKEMVIAKLLSEYGYDPGVYLDESKLKETPIEPFYVLKHPVTNSQYLDFVQDTQYPWPIHWNHGSEPFPKDRAMHPVSAVSYEDARTFCQWLAQKVRREVRLPRAKEWEVAARGGEKILYPWGDKFNPYRCNSLEYPNTISIFSFPNGASPFGLFHTCGNVWEIVKDTDSQKIEIRGGSWKSMCKVNGITFIPVFVGENYKDYDTGFRVVKLGKQDRKSFRNLFLSEEI